MVMFAANQSVLGEHERKDTVKNAEETGWFVWNMATYDLREAVNLSAKALPPEEDEFEFAGVEKRNALKRLVTESKHLLYILSVNMSKQCVSLLAIQYQL